MATDLSRVRSDPLLDFAGVELKQGGVLLDADFNEGVSITDRRLRAAASDILGRARVSSTTPDAFRITALATGLGIGRGRLYVDGLLAENHGAAPDDPADRSFDPLLAAPVFLDDLEYATQPYLPDPPTLPAQGRHLVYLDVWQRQVTHLERPALVESAVGVETSSRLQTVWQVQVMPETLGSGITCATPDEQIPGWPQQIATSDGRLTTGTVEVSPAEDPCELPPTGGYRGLENQLYRVEIHDPGQPGGTATFKWSRDNASVGSRVASLISTTELELDSVGRDEVLRFNTGDWIEIVDDRREFSQAAGEMRRIIDIDDASRRIVLSAPPPAEMLPSPAVFPDSEHPRAANLRVRRWDQKGLVYRTDASGTPVQIQDLDASSDGLIAVPAGAVEVILEHGVTVRFDSAGPSGFHAGDWWVFAARTGDASVEPLEQSPPRGIHHHYARLGVWDVPNGTVTDCRNPWPPPVTAGGDTCACTVCVDPERHASGQMTLQMAIDLVRQRGGGTVCIEVGTYALDEPLDLGGARSLRLVGKGMNSVLITTGRAIQIGAEAQDVRLEGFAVLTRPPFNEIADDAVVLAAAREVVLERLWVRVLNDNPNWAAIALRGALVDVAIRDCVLGGAFGVRSGSADGAEAGLSDLRIDDNSFDCSEIAVDLRGVTVHQLVGRLRGNRVLGCLQAGLVLAGDTATGHGFEVSGNALVVAGDGIIAGLDGLHIHGNVLLQAEFAEPQRQSGVRVVGGLRQGIDDCRILGNRITGFHGAAVMVNAPRLAAMMIKHNRIDRVGQGIVLEGVLLVEQLSIENNQLSQVAEVAIDGEGREARMVIGGNQIDVRGPVFAVRVQYETGEIAFSQNQIRCLEAGDRPDVALAARLLIVSSNQAQGGQIAFDLRALQRLGATVVGNITRGTILLNGTGLPGPWNQLNNQGV